jgi:hypothetical protein
MTTTPARIVQFRRALPAAVPLIPLAIQELINKEHLIIDERASYTVRVGAGAHIGKGMQSEPLAEVPNKRTPE